MDRDTSSSEQRRLAAIMFTDMVGFTAITQRSEQTALEILDRQRKVMRPLFTHYNGREIQVVGDGFLVEFASALEAVQCAIDIQIALKTDNEDRPEDTRFQIRIGIHMGDVIHRGNDVAGDAVNVASRIEPLALPGGICITSQVHASVANKIPAAFESIGTPPLKNVATPIEVFRIAGYGSRMTAARPSISTLPKDRIAVLPLTNISQEAGDEYFADGLTEELIGSISQIQGLRVIARTSVMRFKGANKPIREIGQELNVGSVLEGTVRKAGDKIRISIRFIETINEEPRWSQNFDREIQDIFSIQREIAEKVSQALQEQALVTESLPAEGRAPKNMDAYILYLRGRQSWNKRTEADLKQAILFFEQALQLDSSYARAYAGIADSYAALALLEFMAPSEAYPKAAAAVKQALVLDPRLPDALTSQGLIYFQYEWNWSAAEETFKQAIHINPNYAPAHHFYADYLKAMARFDEALAEIEKARELDPLSLAINTGVGHVLYLSRQYDRAILEYQKAVDLDPNFMATHLWFGRPYLEKGMYREALSELETAVRLSGESTVALAMLGHGLASAGLSDAAYLILEKLKERSTHQYVPSYWIAVIYNGFQDKDQVLSWLGEAYQERSSWLVWSNVEPRFDWLRNDPDFTSLLSPMQFPR